MSIHGRNSKIWHRSQKTITCTRHERDPNLDLLKKLNETSTYMTDDSTCCVKKSGNFLKTITLYLKVKYAIKS